MEDIISSTAHRTKRDIPTIGGSPAAFILVIIILVIIIIVACTASFYLLREEANADHEALTHRTRTQYHLPGSQPSRPPRKSKNKSWYLSSIPGILGKDSQREETHSDFSKSKVRSSSRKGRVQVDNGGDSDWDDSSDTEMANHKLQSTSRQCEKSLSSVPMSQKDAATSVLPSGSLNGSRVFSPSEAASSVHFDPHGVRGLPYLDRAAPQPTNISIQSHLYSPINSPSSSPPPNPKRRSIPVSIETVWSNESQVGNSQAFTAHPQASVYTFQSGSKFIENL